MDSPHTTIEDAARDLAQAHTDLQDKLELLSRSTPACEHLKHQAQRQLGVVEHLVVCVQDAIGYSIAEELTASKGEAC